MMWIISNSIFRLVVTGLCIVAITKYRHMFNPVERVGLGMTGGCSLLTVSVIWERQNSPFDGWASCLFTLGCGLFLSGMIYRKGKHDRNNARQLVYHREWKEQRR